VYHLSVHSALAMTPLAAWHEGIAKKGKPLRRPSDEREFFLDFLPAVPRRIQRDGIHFNNIRYWDNILSPWAGRLIDSLLVKYDPRNLSRVYVRDPSGRHWPVPYANLGQPPISLWELDEARKELRKQGKNSQAERAIFANILEQRRIVEMAVSTAKRRRQQEKTPADSRTPREFNPQPASAKEASVEMKPYPVEIWEGP
jgi:putative transposase